ncbi:hypothetical protein GQX74_004880 [Glossina fuscipes]|nr:hypothetical protein GQX74_004880 [Glossina fuscipes]
MVTRKLVQGVLTARILATDPKFSPAGQKVRPRPCELEYGPVEGSTEDPLNVLHNAASRNVPYMTMVRVCSGEACRWKKNEELCLSSGLTSRRHIEEILQEHLVLFSGFTSKNLIFMPANRRPLIALVRYQYLEEIDVPVTAWPRFQSLSAPMG